VLMAHKDNLLLVTVLYDQFVSCFDMVCIPCAVQGFSTWELGTWRECWNVDELRHTLYMDLKKIKMTSPRQDKQAWVLEIQHLVECSPCA